MSLSSTTCNDGGALDSMIHQGGRAWWRASLPIAGLLCSEQSHSSHPTCSQVLQLHHRLWPQSIMGRSSTTSIGGK